MVALAEKRSWPDRSLRSLGCLHQPTSTIHVYEDVCWLQVAVNDPLHVAVSNTGEQLVEKLLDFEGVKEVLAKRL